MTEEKFTDGVTETGGFDPKRFKVRRNDYRQVHVGVKPLLERVEWHKGPEEWLADLAPDKAQVVRGMRTYLAVTMSDDCPPGFQGTAYGDQPCDAALSAMKVAYEKLGVNEELYKQWMDHDYNAVKRAIEACRAEQPSTGYRDFSRN